MLIKKKINFALEFRRKGTKENGNNEVNQENLPLRMRVSYNNMRIEFVTGYRIDANKWDAENQRATGMTKLMQTASEVNDYLAFLKAEIIKVFHKYELMEVMPTREQIKEDFNKRIEQNYDENWNDSDPDNEVTTEKKSNFWPSFNEFIRVNGII